MYDPYRASLYLTAIKEGNWDLIAKNIKKSENRRLEKRFVISCIDDYAKFHSMSVEDLCETLDANLGDTK